MLQNYCCVCLNKDEELREIREEDDVSERLLEKLRYCVPEVEWSEADSMCGKCVLQLRAVYTFKKLSIESYLNRRLTEAPQAQGGKYSSSCDKAVFCNSPGHSKQAEAHGTRATTDLVCQLCGKSFRTKLSLSNHVRLKRCKNKRGEHEAESKVNDKSSAISRVLRKAVAEKAVKTNKCDTCQVEFSNKYLLKRHVRNVHAAEKNHNCDVCGQKFASPVYLSAHKRYHSGDRPHICSFCGKGYITTSDLYHHEKIHANKRAYKCAACSKAFNTSSDLHKHKICVHVDRSLWKYVCNFCERRFPLKTNLDSHTKTHTGERNFACHLCDRRCINRSALQRHIESHSNVRPFKCGVCGQDYKYRKSLDVHSAKAHGIGDAKVPQRTKRYFCHACPKAYFDNNKLQKHIRTHTGERPFACHLCEKRFIDKSYVKQHLKTAHSFAG